MKYIRDDDQVTPQRVKPGTVRRVLPYFVRYRWAILLLLFITAVDSATTVVNPVLLGFIVDDGILRHRVDVVVALSLAAGGRRALRRPVPDPVRAAGDGRSRATRLRRRQIPAAADADLMRAGVRAAIVSTTGSRPGRAVMIRTIASSSPALSRANAAGAGAAGP